MKIFAAALLILAAAAGVLGICVYVSASGIEDGWGALARGGLGLLIIGLALLLAVSGAAVFLDLYLKNKRNGKAGTLPKIGAANTFNERNKQNEPKN
ncbi:MAG: hypothetical protein NC299_03840 [Lachnospiraceae bacterium]|nr:hypothetical protein [Ruminococcus sp.]MCM1274478.1 hypothetical protein [Lachnospiraceae bacterium]